MRIRGETDLFSLLKLLSNEFYVFLLLLLSRHRSSLVNVLFGQPTYTAKGIAQRSEGALRQLLRIGRFAPLRHRQQGLDE